MPTRQEKQEAAAARNREDYLTATRWWGARATEYREGGHDFFIMSLTLQGSQADILQGGRYAGVDPAGFLQAVERAGWTLFDCGYVYMTTRNQSHILTDSTSVEGAIIATYTFRRTQ